MAKRIHAFGELGMELVCRGDRNARPLHFLVITTILIT